MSTAEAKTQQEVGTRVISIISTRGEKVKVAFSGTAWSELKEILERGGTDVNGKAFSRFDLKNMKCVEGINKTTLEHEKAVVPDGDFSLYLMPYKSKSGALSRTEAYSQIKAFMAEDEEKAKAHFNEGKNYTVKSTEVLADLIESYKPGTKKSVNKEKAKAISDVVESVKTAATEDDLMEVLQGLSNNEKLDVVIKLLVGMKSSSTSVADVKPTDSQIPATPVKTAEEIAKEEAEQKEREEREAEERKREEERLAEEKRLREEREADEREMRELARGFNDVKI